MQKNILVLKRHRGHTSGGGGGDGGGGGGGDDDSQTANKGKKDSHPFLPPSLLPLNLLNPQRKMVDEINFVFGKF